MAINESIQIVERGMSFEKWLENANLNDRRLAYNYYLKSEILADLRKKKLAIEAANKSFLIAQKIESKYYMKINEDNIEKWIEE